MRPHLQRITVIIFLLLGLVTPVFARDLEQQATFAAPILVVNTSFLNIRTGPGVEYPVLVTVVGGTELPVLSVANDKVWYQVNTDGGPGWVNVEFTLARGSFTNVPIFRADATNVAALGQGGGFVGTTTTTGANRRFTGINFNNAANLRAAPSFEALIVRSAYSEPNVVYPLLDQVRDTTTNTDWYLVNIPSVGTVWTDRVQFSILECGTDNVGTIQFETAIRFEGISTRQGFLLQPNTDLYMLDFEGTSTRAELLDGTIGLVDSAAVKRRTGVRSVCDAIPTAFATGSSGISALGQGGGGTESSTQPTGITGNRAVVNTGNLNIRSGPSAGYSVVATVRGGTELAVVGRTRDGVWFYVTGSFGDGWLNSQFVLFRGNYPSIPVISPDSLPAISTSSNASLGQGGGGGAGGTIVSGRQVTGIIFNEAANLRDAPSFDALILRSAYSNASSVFPLVNTLRDANNVTWYQVNVKDVGVIWTDRVRFALLACGTDNVGVTTGETFLRFDGLSNRDALPLVSNTEVYRQGFRDTFTIVELIDGTMGFVETNSLKAREGISSYCDGVVPSRVTSTSGTTTTTTSTTQTTAITGNRAVVNTGNLNIRSGPNAGFAPVATVAGGTELAVVGRTKDGVWLLVQADFGQGWVNSEFVLFRGNYASVPVVEF